MSVPDPDERWEDQRKGLREGVRLGVAPCAPSEAQEGNVQGGRF